MNKFLIIFFTLLVGTSSIFAQKKEKGLSLTNSTITEKFDFVIKKSNSYQDFKVVKKNWLNTLKTQVLDSVSKQKSTNKALTKTIEDQNSNTKKLESKIEELNTTITQISTDKEHISFLGNDLKKSDFKTIFWSCVSLLAVLLAFFIFKFKNSNTITQEVKAQLADIEKEFDDHRKTALEREQKVMRKLQDELNKNRG